jgi:hypothetical protein
MKSLSFDGWRNRQIQETIGILVVVVVEREESERVMMMKIGEEHR